jgi:hypothetical protein
MGRRSRTTGARELACDAIPRYVPTGSLSWGRVTASRWTRPFSSSAASDGAKTRPGTDPTGPMTVRPYYDRMIVERLPESLTWVSTNVIPATPSQGSLVQDDTHERVVNLEVAVVLDEPELAKLVHEEVDARARRADHLGEHFL